MNGALAIAKTLAAAGIDACFANPGTSEMHLVAALDQVPQIRCVLGLTENVVTGAADGYARIAGRPAATLLHCGPGLANGISNLHNAKRAGVPVVNLVGDQATYHAPLDPPLAAETEALARSVSSWTRVSRTALRAPGDVAEAIAAARARSQVATVILPSDVCWDEGAAPARPWPDQTKPKPDAVAVKAVAAALAKGHCALLLGGGALHGRALGWAGAIAQRTGAQLLAPSANAKIQRGPGIPPVARLPYAAESARGMLSGLHALILVGTAVPVPFFAYPGRSAMLVDPGTSVLVLANPAEDLEAALESLADAVSARPAARGVTAGGIHGLPDGKISATALSDSLCALLPAGSIIVDESVSFGRDIYARTAGAPEHDWLQLTGGAIGDGIPMATGAAIAAGTRRVVGLQADGSAMYSIQGLWTQARLHLNVTTIVLSNRKYATLYAEMKNVGAAAGHAAAELFDLSRPEIRWTDLAASMGVESGVASTMPEFNDLFRYANGRPGPMVIELRIPE